MRSNTLINVSKRRLLGSIIVLAILWFGIACNQFSVRQKVLTDTIDLNLETNEVYYYGLSMDTLNFETTVDLVESRPSFFDFGLNTLDNTDAVSFWNDPYYTDETLWFDDEGNVIVVDIFTHNAAYSPTLSDVIDSYGLPDMMHIDFTAKLLYELPDDLLIVEFRTTRVNGDGCESAIMRPMMGIKVLRTDDVLKEGKPAPIDMRLPDDPENWTSEFEIDGNEVTLCR